MSLTIGAGPFGPFRAGTFNAVIGEPSGHVLFLDPLPRRVRGELAGETVVDSRHAFLLHETGHLPVWYFPRADVRIELLEGTEHRTHCPFKGDASYWSVRAGDRVAENAAWAYPDPIPEAPDGLADLVAFYFDRLDRWWEEDEERLGHPRDPYHRIDVLPTSDPVLISVDGVTLAETTQARALFETGLPVRYYVPEEDVRWDALGPVEGLRTRCAYKGLADRWWGTEGVTAVAWSYPEPIPELAQVAGTVAFFNERVRIEVAGEPLASAPTPFGSEEWTRAALERSPAVR